MSRKKVRTKGLKVRKSEEKEPDRKGVKGRAGSAIKKRIRKMEKTSGGFTRECGSESNGKRGSIGATGMADTSKNARGKALGGGRKNRAKGPGPSRDGAQGWAGNNGAGGTRPTMARKTPKKIESRGRKILLIMRKGLRLGP